MNLPAGDSVEPEQLPVPTWSWRHWGLLVVFVLAIQIGFIFALGDWQAVKPRPISPVKVWRLEDPLTVLEDPALFALPNAHGVAGLTWLKPPAVAFPPFRWSEPPRLLALRAEGLGLVRAGPESFSSGPGLAIKPQPQPLELAPTPPAIASAATNSTARVTGSLTERRWLNPPVLRSWTGTNLLIASVVQTLVDESGQVASLTLLPPGSGSREADDHALQLVRAARFAPAAIPGPPVVGRISFHWYTQPPAPAPAR